MSYMKYSTIESWALGQYTLRVLQYSSGQFDENTTVCYSVQLAEEGEGTHRLVQKQFETFEDAMSFAEGARWLVRFVTNED